MLSPITGCTDAYYCLLAIKTLPIGATTITMIGAAALLQQPVLRLLSRMQYELYFGPALNSYATQSVSYSKFSTSVSLIDDSTDIYATTPEYFTQCHTLHRFFPQNRLIMRRSSEASLFFLGFPRKKSLFITGRTSIGCQNKKQNIFCMCVIVCVIQHRNWPLRSTILNAHGTNASPDGLCTRTHTNEAFSCCFAVHRFELIEACAATCVERHAWAVFKILR